jgi:pimeloyl-ACP methyl ester carboxylesterase
LALGILMSCAALAQGQLDGRWRGAIEIQGASLEIEVAFTTGPQGLAASIDIPRQGAKELPLKSVSFEVPRVHFELPAGPGLAIFEGQLKDGVISGTFRQGGASGTFTLRREGVASAPASASEALPYATDEVTVKNGDVTLAGTLSVPEGRPPFPAVVFVSGSGPQDRDEEVLGFKIFRTLADHLTRNGFAVLRTDDRGVGKSTGNLRDSTSEDFAGDAIAEVAYLKTRPEIDPARIGILGHSEGGIVAPIAAARSGDVAFIIVMAGPAVTGERILQAQNELVARAEGQSEADAQANGELQRMMFAAVRTNQGWEELDAAIRRLVLARVAKLPAAQQKAIPDVNAYAAQTAAAQVAGAKSPWFKFFLDYDPAPALEKVTCPVLALFGEKDVQVPADLNRPAMAAAFAKSGNRTAVIKVIPGANHLFQAAKTGGVREYAQLPHAFTPEFLGAVTVWLRATTQRQ